MSLNNAFREVAIARSKKQPQMVDQLLEEAPILAEIPMQDSTDGLHNVYEEIQSVTGAQLVDADESLPVVNMTTSLKQVDLSIIGGIIEVGEDKAKAYPGGAPGYFADKQPGILRKTGMDLEQSILYNNFRAFASANGKLQSAGGSANTNYTILAVHYVSGEITGLFDSNGFGNGAIMDVTALSGGSLYKDANSRLVKGIRYKSYMGIQLANARYLSGIANIDIDNSNTPTEEQIEDMLEDCRASSGSTRIYCHPRVLRLVLSQFKSAALQTVVTDRNFNTLINMWDDITIQTSRNFLPGTEPNVTV